MTSDLSKYTIGWITALHIELAAATVMLDEEHPGLPLDEQDPTLYTLGRTGGHNVVVACLPGGQTGPSAATAVATKMLNKFRSIKVGFMVDIGGGVPNRRADIRLGDVVVSFPEMSHGGVVQYDFGKAEADGHFRRTGYLNTPPKLLLNVVNQARSNYELGRSAHASHLAAFGPKTALKQFSRSSAGQDMLFQPTYSHAGGYTCKNCRSEMLIERSVRDCENSSDGGQPVFIHFGTIASGSKVIKDAKTRDEIAEALGGQILCFEMEAAGLMNDFSCLIVRGICDYADSHKQDQWQRYAAATAAAYAKELILLIPGNVAALSSLVSRCADSGKSPVLSVPFRIPFQRNSSFVGRDNIFSLLHDVPLHCHTEAVLWGIGGCGKSAVAIELGYRIREHEPNRAVFWVTAIDLDSFKQAFREIARIHAIPGADDLGKDIMTLVRAKLEEESTAPWFMVVDNADDPDVMLSHTDADYRLPDCLPRRVGCRTLFTTRSNGAAVKLVGISSSIVELGRLDEGASYDLYTSAMSGGNTAHDRLVRVLLGELSHLPLAIIQAIAFMRENSVGIHEYLDLFRSQKMEDRSTDLLSEDFKDPSRYRKASNAVTTTWHVSFLQLRRCNKLAVQVLSYLACITPTNIPESMVLPNASDLQRTKAIGTLIGYQFLTRHRDRMFFDVHPLVHMTTRRWLEQEGSWRDHLRNALDALTRMIPHGGYQNHEVYQFYLPHGLCLLGHVGTRDEATTDLSSRIADCQWDLGDYSRAERSHREVLAWRKLNLGYSNPKTLQKMQDVGHNEMMKGGYYSAEAMHRETFALRYMYLGLTDHRTLGSMLDIAEALGFQEQWDEHGTLIRELVKVSGAWLGTTHDITVSCLKALSVSHCRKGRFEQAINLARRVASNRSKRLGDTHPTALRSISHLASILTRAGQWDKAEELEMKASSEFEISLGADHPDTLTSKCNLSRIKIQIGKTEAAQIIFGKILEARTKILGSSHPDTVTSRTYVLRYGKASEPTDLEDSCEQAKILAVPDSTTFNELHTSDWSLPLAVDFDRAYRMWGSTNGKKDRAAMSAFDLLRKVDVSEPWIWLRRNLLQAPFVQTALTHDVSCEKHPPPSTLFRESHYRDIQEHDGLNIATVCEVENPSQRLSQARRRLYRSPLGVPQIEYSSLVSEYNYNRRYGRTDDTSAALPRRSAFRSVLRSSHDHRINREQENLLSLQPERLSDREVSLPPSELIPRSRPRGFLEPIPPSRPRQIIFPEVVVHNVPGKH